MYVFIDILRAIATCLVTNSHFDIIYSSSLFAKGGAFGNSIFFLATGFCLANCSNEFKGWYPKRLVRLYVPLILITSFSLYDGSSLLETIFFSYVFPVNYWFICSLVILYPIYYFVINHSFPKRKYICFGILLVLYVVIYLFLDKSTYVVETAGFYGIRFSYIVSLLLMLIGGYIRKNIDTCKSFAIKRRLVIIISFIISFALYFIFFLLMFKYELYKIQFIETILCNCALIMLSLTVLSFDDALSSKKENIFIRILRFIGSCTLEIYLVQFPIINIIAPLKICSSYKVVLVIASILICANVLKLISNFIINKLIYRRSKA